ncbi:MAG: IS1634 family transposase [Clostridia bacterium]|nr:IS1634 family transposase [Clostridia bacterium]
MFIHVIPNRNSRPAVLLRESRRDESGKVRKQTLANLTDWPPGAVQALRDWLEKNRGGEGTPAEGKFAGFENARECGNIKAIRLAMSRLGMAELLSSRPCRERSLALAMIAERLAHPATKLKSVREFRVSTVGEDFGVEDATVDGVYAAMDWLAERQERIERKLEKRHVQSGGVVFYDLSSSSYYGENCPLAEWGYNRDGEKLKCIEYGLAVDSVGRPLSIRVYPGGTSDAETVPDEVARLRRLGVRVILAGDRGMLTSARIEALRKLDGVGWLSCLRHGDVRKVVRDSMESDSPLFDQRNIAEITHEDFPGERLVVCYNEVVAEESRLERNELVRKTEEALQKVAEGLESSLALGRKAATDLVIGRRAERAMAKWKVGKFFEVSANKGRLVWRRLDDKIAEEARYDGLWVVRTSEPADALPAEDAVRRYKELEKAERAFRTFKGYDLLVRPIHHRLDRRVRGHFFLCLLAQYVEWHMRKALAPMLFDDEDIEEVRRTRAPVRAAKPSEGAKRKRARASSPDDDAPVAWTTLLKELATLTRADVLLGDDPRLHARIRRESIPTPRQAEALRLLAAPSPWWPPTGRGQ